MSGDDRDRNDGDVPRTVHDALMKSSAPGNQEVDR
jgi:hypothetical protein